jgi:hypothetical protein
MSTCEYETKHTDINQSKTEATIVGQTPGIERLKGENGTCMGGRYEDLSKIAGPDQEVHHLPPASVTDLQKKDGPAIIMDRDDHRKLESTGQSKGGEASDFRQDIRDKYDAGHWKQAIEHSVTEVQMQFDSKYDEAMKQAWQYAERSGAFKNCGRQEDR